MLIHGGGRAGASSRISACVAYLISLAENRGCGKGTNCGTPRFPVINPRPSAEGGFLVFDLDQGFPELNGEPRAGRSPLPEWYYGR